MFNIFNKNIFNSMEETCSIDIDIDKEIKKSLKKKEIMFLMSLYDISEKISSHNTFLDDIVVLPLAFIYNITNNYCEICDDIFEEEDEEKELEEAIQKEITNGLEIDQFIDNYLSTIKIDKTLSKKNIQEFALNNITCRCETCSKINQSIENYKTLSLEDPTILKIKNIIDKIIKKLNIEINI
jgi:hypothetical protein